MQSSFFVISNRGHAGSLWLSHALNLHPRIVALHSGGIATYYNGGSGVCVSPKDFLPSLIKYRELSQDLKYFGTIHMYHGSSALEATRALGGLFSAVIRNPIKRINSIFWNRVTIDIYNEDYRYLNKGTVETEGMKDPYMQIGELTPSQLSNFTSKYLDYLIHVQPWELMWDPFNGMFRLFSQWWFRTFPARIRNRIKYGNQIINTSKIIRSNPDLFLLDRFAYSCVNTFHFDLECFESLGANGPIIKFEQMVKDREYFLNTVWPFIAPDYNCSKNYLDNVFSIGKENSKVASLKQPDEIYDEWPIYVKDLYIQIVNHFGRDRLEKMYKNYGYILF